MWRGESVAAAKIRAFSGYRFAATEVQESPSVLAGMEVSQDSNVSEKLAQEEFTESLTPLLAYPELRAPHRQQLSPEAIKLRQCTSGELCWSAAVSRPDICTRLARIKADDGSRSDIWLVAHVSRPDICFPS